MLVHACTCSLLHVFGCWSYKYAWAQYVKFALIYYMCPINFLWYVYYVMIEMKLDWEFFITCKLLLFVLLHIYYLVYIDFIPFSLLWYMYQMHFHWCIFDFPLLNVKKRYDLFVMLMFYRNAQLVKQICYNF